MGGMSVTGHSIVVKLEAAGHPGSEHVHSKAARRCSKHVPLPLLHPSACPSQLQAVCWHCAAAQQAARTQVHQRVIIAQGPRSSQSSHHRLCIVPLVQASIRLTRCQKLVQHTTPRWRRRCIHLACANCAQLVPCAPIERNCIQTVAACA